MEGPPPGHTHASRDALCRGCSRRFGAFTPLCNIVPELDEREFNVGGMEIRGLEVTAESAGGGGGCCSIQ